MNSLLPSPQNYSTAHNAIAGLWNPLSEPTEGPDDGSDDITKWCFLFWASVKSYVQKLFYQMGPVDVMGLARFQSLVLTSSRKLSTYAHEGHGDYGRTSS